MSKHLISVSQLGDRYDVLSLFKNADRAMNGIGGISGSANMKGKILASLFLEPSTRTRLSFESAMLQAGGQIITVADSIGSSAMKGESLADTIKTVSHYSDIIVVRTPNKGELCEAAKASLVPVINGGDGDGEHPTQSLLDLYTVWKEFGEIDGCTFILRGDLKYSRTVHSLCRLLKRFNVLTMAWPHPDLAWKGDSNTTTIIDYDERLIKEPVIVYTTRPQKERYKTVGEAMNISGRQWAITREAMEWLPKKSLVLHALPRSIELPDDVDNMPNLGIWKQVKYGVPLRAALMHRAVSSENPWLDY